MKTETPAGILFTAAEVAAASGLDQLRIRGLEPVDFGAPGHWHMAGNQVVYTERGIVALVESMVAQNLLAESAKLYAALVKVREARSVPSRALIEAQEPYCRKGSYA
jgi:hypothetical protein